MRRLADSDTSGTSSVKLVGRIPQNRVLQHRSNWDGTGRSRRSAITSPHWRPLITSDQGVLIWEALGHTPANQLRNHTGRKPSREAHDAFSNAPSGVRARRTSGALGELTGPFGPRFDDIVPLAPGLPG